MKEAVKEYLNLTEQEKQDLWKNAVFVFDTNIFLNLYRYTEDTRESLLKAMEQLSDRIWMPKQVAQELMKDRTKVIFDTLKIFEELKEEKNKFINNCREKLRRENKDKKIDEMSKAIDKHIEGLIKESNYIEYVDDDKILNQLLNLFEKKVGIGFTDTELDEIKKEGTNRYSKQIPPGYKDFKKGEENNAFGDLIIWKEILLFAKNNQKDIIYVTGDQKEDWWDRVNGRTLGPRVELRKEFCEETKKNFHMYSMNGFLVHFKDMQGSPIQQSAIDEVENYERILAKKQRSIKEEYRRRRELEHMEMDRHHLMMVLNELSEKQVGAENRINELQQIIKNNDIQATKNVTEFEKYNRLLDELNGNQAHLANIIQKKNNIQKEIEHLTWKREKLINSYESREEEFIHV